VRIKIIDKG